MNKHSIAKRAKQKGLRMTAQRIVICEVLDSANDHPDAELVYTRAHQKDPQISLATVYRTLKQFEEAGLIERVDFNDGRARYQDALEAHHDHLIDVETGEVIEFVDPDIEALQIKIAAKLGYSIEGHRLEIFGRKIK